MSDPANHPPIFPPGTAVLHPYKCHKTVYAAKIANIPPSECELPEDRVGLELVGGTLVAVTLAWQRKHRPEPGGYFVVYGDGYSSYSPAKAFESGYTRLLNQGVGDGSRHPAVMGVLQFFEFEHLPANLQEVSRPFAGLAGEIADGPQNAETTMALRKLLEAKDCAVRARLVKAV